MSQNFKKEYYKTVKIHGENFYYFKVLESWDNKPYKLAWISVYRDRQGTDFVVESGAGISQKRMESQIKSYFKRRR